MQNTQLEEKVMRGSWLLIGIVILSQAPGRGVCDEILRSTVVPLSVHYTDTSQLTFAQMVLADAEAAWAFQVDGLGYPPPPADAGAFGSDDYDIFIRAGIDLGVTTEDAHALDRPLGYCSHIEIDPSAPTWVLPLMVAHEFQHALQSGIRSEGNNITEASALYISGIEITNGGWALSYFLGINEMQKYPFRALDWEAELGNYYTYGGGLYLAFLEQVYGTGVEGELTAEIWNRLGDESTRDYFAAISSLVDFDAAYKQFARWRYFVGPKDDGQHIQNLENWEGPNADEKLESVAIDATHTLSDLPILGRIPTSPPMPYGATYVELSLAGAAADDTLKVSFAGGSGARWSMETMVVSSAAEAIEQDTDADASGEAEIEISVGGGETLVLAFVNLGSGDYMPNGPHWSANTMAYWIEVLPKTTTTEGSSSSSGCNAAGVSGVWTAAGVVLGLRLRRRPLSRRQR